MIPTTPDTPFFRGLPGSVTTILPADLLRHLEEAGWTAQQVIGMFGLVRATLDEDLAWGEDITTIATIPPEARSTATVTSREEGYISGVIIAALVPYIAQTLTSGTTTSRSHGITVELHQLDGARVYPGEPVITLNSPTRTILTAERTLLNLLCHLCGVATTTAAWVHAVSSAPGTRATVRDTRKTMPGLRLLEKHAVVHGGGHNHRMGLGDAALIKDNHIAAVGSISEAFRRVRAYAPDIPIEVECDTLEHVKDAVHAGANLILLDNMNRAQIREALHITRPAGVKTEASGGLTLENAAQYAATGVDYIAVGELTHSAPALDLGLDFTSTH